MTDTRGVTSTWMERHDALAWGAGGGDVLTRLPARSPAHERAGDVFR